MSKELTKFHRATTINSAGELMVNAGRYSRGAVIAAFEMMGGLDTFASWAEENQSEFYTKLFGKLIGREVEHKSTDDLEGMLEILDGESEEVTDAEIIEETAMTVVDAEFDDEPVDPRQLRMARAAAAYADAEPLD